MDGTQDPRRTARVGRRQRPSLREGRERPGFRRRGSPRDATRGFVRRALPRIRGRGPARPGAPPHAPRPSPGARERRAGPRPPNSRPQVRHRCVGSSPVTQHPPSATSISPASSAWKTSIEGIPRKTGRPVFVRHTGQRRPGDPDKYDFGHVDMSNLPFATCAGPRRTEPPPAAARASTSPSTACRDGRPRSARDGTPTTTPNEGRRAPRAHLPRGTDRPNGRRADDGPGRTRCGHDVRRGQVRRRAWRWRVYLPTRDVRPDHGVRYVAASAATYGNVRKQPDASRP